MLLGLRSRFCAIFFICAIACPSLVFAQSDISPIVPKPWPQEFMENLPGKVRELKYRLANAVFDGKTDLALGSVSFGEDDNLKIKFSMSRDVYYNYLIDDSWTVIDRLTFRPQLKLLRLLDAKNGYAAPETGNFYTYAGFTFNSEGTFEWRDVRVMTPAEAYGLKPVELENHKETIEETIKKKPRQKRRGSAKTPSVPQSVLPTPQGEFLDEDIDFINPLAMASLNTSLSVKKRRILNPLTIPFRIPLFKVSANTLKKKMIDGEVLSYSISGQVSFGANFGAKVIYSLAKIFSAAKRWVFGPEINVSVRIIDNFQVSIKRESERYARVRISNIVPQEGLLKKPFTLQGKIGTDLRHIFNGVLVFTKNGSEKRVGKQTIKIAPLVVSYSETPLYEINLTYRYDLETEDGREAFHKAVLGNYELSEEISKEQQDYFYPAVSFVSKEEGNRFNINANLSSDVAFLYKKSFSRILDEIRAELIDENGTRDLYRSTAEKRKDKKTIFGSREKISRKISIFMDEEGFKNNDCDSFLILAENNVEDSSTNAKQLNHYTQDVNTLLGETVFNRIFPDRKEEEEGGGKAWYGRSSFYYGFTIRDDDFFRLMHVDENTVLEKAQKHGLNITLAKWRELKRVYQKREVDRFQELIKEMFEVRRKVQNTMTFFTDVLPKKRFHKFLVAQNISFGTIQMRGHQLSSIEESLAQAEQEMGTTSDTFRTVQDPDAVLSNLKVEPNDKGLLKVSFDVENTPAFMSFRLDPTTSKTDRKPIVFTLYNRDAFFKKGHNEFVLDPADTNILIRALTQGLKFGEQLNLTVGYSQKGAIWGYGDSGDFKVPKAYDKRVGSP